MKIHLSVDDVIYSFMDLYNKSPRSVFDVPFFGSLKQLNDRYGAVFTLYAFENYAESFFVNDVPENYWIELADAGFIRIGFHGTFFREDFKVFENKCRNFYSCFPECLWADTIRLHRYEADTDMLDTLRRYGVSTFLCREDESRTNRDFPPSYTFSENDEKKTGVCPIEHNGSFYVKTSFRIEFHECGQLLKKLYELISVSPENALIAVFTHEKNIFDHMESIVSVCEMISRRCDTEFTF